MADQLFVSLNTGASMPQLGFGVFQVPPDKVAQAVTTALEAGYRSIDTAAMYGNEEGVGKAITSSGLDRQELFVTTKLANHAHASGKAQDAFDGSLSRLGLDYVDLYLIHWPLPARDSYVDAWRALERVAGSGRARAIGVSNFQAEHLQRLLGETDIVPAVNQIELHPYLAQEPMRTMNGRHHIATEAWSPIGQGGEVLRDEVVTGIAEKYAVSAAQAVIRWHLQIGNVVIPKSVTPERIAQNFDVFGFELDEDDVEAISGLDRHERLGPDPDEFDPV